MRPRLVISLATGKTIGFSSRLLRAGGGTTLPGRVARAIDPGLVTEMTRELTRGCVLVTGTNGKTTTATLLASILDLAGISTIHNRSGANLMAGIASSLMRESSMSGRVDGEIGLFEVDEAALPAAIREISPRIVLVNNLFRDQLDRYGELDTLARRMKEAIGAMDPESTVVLNADDPLVASIGEGLGQNVMYYGIDTDKYASDSMQHAADSKHCVACGARLAYEYYLFGHLGRYVCRECGSARPEPTVAATEMEMEGMEGTRCTIRYPGGAREINFPLPGLYNIYNVLAAFACSMALGIDPGTIVRAIGTFRAAFGRVERVQLAEREILVILAKNPAGFNEVIRTLSADSEPKDLMIALNDNIADGRDVSWIWDVDFEMLRGRVKGIICAGIRAWDMALRVKYAELEEESLVIEPDLQRALDTGLEAVPFYGTFYVVPTYTAMLDFRKLLEKRDLVAPFWEG